MELEISDELAHHCPKTVAWLGDPKASGTEPIAIHLEQFFSHMDVDQFLDAIESDALTGARSHKQLQFDVSDAIHALPLASPWTQSSGHVTCTSISTISGSSTPIGDMCQATKHFCTLHHACQSGIQAFESIDAITRSSLWRWAICLLSSSNCRPAVRRVSRRSTAKSTVRSAAEIGRFYSRSNRQ